jgi:hypothetical protein
MRITETTRKGVLSGSCSCAAFGWFDKPSSFVSVPDGTKDLVRLGVNTFIFIEVEDTLTSEYLRLLLGTVEAGAVVLVSTGKCVTGGV